MQRTVSKNSLSETKTADLDLSIVQLDREAFTRKIEDFLESYCLEQINEAEKVGPGYVELWHQINDYIKGGGKRIRPYMLALSYIAHGGKELNSIIPIAASIELFHTFLLVHDDIIDRDTTRHGKLNITGVYLKKYGGLSPEDARHYADSAALLAGDLLLNATHGIVNSSDASMEAKSKILSYYRKAMFLTGGGELIDVESAMQPINQSDPDSIMLNKTAIYSFMFPLASGAVLANASQTQIDQIEELGLELGLIFQETDDLLGVFGDQEQTGKSNRTDIREKKRTSLIKAAYQSSDSEIKSRLDQLYNFDHTLTDSEVDEVFEIIQESGAEDVIQKDIERKAAKATEQISKLRVNEYGQQALLSILKKVSKRNH